MIETYIIYVCITSTLSFSKAINLTEILYDDLESHNHLVGNSLRETITKVEPESKPYSFLNIGMLLVKLMVF